MRVNVLPLPSSLRREICGMLNEKNIDVVANAYFAGAYDVTHEVRITMKKPVDLKDVADEVFDLTNHPGRQEERELLYGRHASVSVGDIIEVEIADGPEEFAAYACCSFGWERLV